MLPQKVLFFLFIFCSVDQLHGFMEIFKRFQSDRHDDSKSAFACRTQLHERGACVPKDLCSSTQNLSEEDVKAFVCPSHEDRLLYCCAKRHLLPPTSNGKSSALVTNATKIAEKMCRIYIEDAPSLGIQMAIIGGSSARTSEFPHMAALGYGEETSKVWSCGGMLISENYVLTAAHCLQANTQGPVKWVKLGDINVEQDEEGHSQEFNVTERIKHPEFKFNLRYHDIALLRLDRAVSFNENVYPACLALRAEDKSKRYVLATGWGSTSFAGESSQDLLKVRLEMFSTAECSEHFRPGNRLSKGIDRDTQICAGSRNDDKDTCDGDSGGPLQFKKRGMVWTVIGITSFGQVCGEPGIPAVYTRVSYYVPWIENIVWPQVPQED